MAKKVKVTLGFPGQLSERELEIPDGEPAPWDAHARLSVVDHAVPRVDALAKVTGRAQYTWDVHPAGMLYGDILRSPHPAAKITKLDLSRAKALPGVRAVWSEPVGKKLLYQGQEIAAVAAVSLDVARDALALVAVEYEKLPFVVDASEAQRPGAPQVFAGNPPPPRRVPSGAEITHQGNVRTIKTETGDLEHAFRSADAIIEGTYRTQVQTQSPLETHGAVAKWDGDALTLWTSTQGTFGVREQVAEALRLSHDQVRVLCDFMGGGFGSKLSAGPYAVIAARLARDARAPVQIMLDRHAEQLCTGNRPDSVQWIKIGARRDGTIVALHLKSYGTPGVGTGAGVSGPARALYKIPALRIEESDVFTNAGAAAPFRAPGHPQGCFALEQAIDELAHKLGLDPVLLRKKNLKNPVQVAELDRLMAKVKRPPQPQGGTLRRGLGIACGVWYKNLNPSTQCQIDIHRDGRVEVLSGAQDIGTGTKTMLAQVAAEELGVPMNLVTVRMGDTQLPVGPASGGSSTTPSLAPAVRSAAYQARQKLPEGKDWKQRCARIPNGKLSVLASRAREYEALEEQIGGVQAAEVVVDLATGRVRVERVVVIQDCGRPINRLTCESQINGGVIQGVSYALLENRLLDRPTGRMVNPNLESYKILTANDCPRIESELFEVSNGGNNAGVAGIGEPTTVPTAAAIANAVHDAIGVRIRELPITPDRVLSALRRGQS